MKRLLLLVPVLILVGMLIVPNMALATACPLAPGDTSDNGVGPSVLDIKPKDVDCSDFGCSSCLKVEPGASGFVESGAYDDGTLHVTITISADGKHFSFTADRWVCAVLVHGGNAGYDVYMNNGAPSDGNLSAPHNVNPTNCGVGELAGLSHVIFCYDAQTPPTPEYSTAILLGIGVLALGGFVWMVRRRGAAEAV